jgi:uncharacterized membrane protein
MSVWHYVQNGRACGPVELAALQALIASGAITPDTLVWQSGTENWVAARSAPELAASIPVSAPPPISIPTAPPLPTLDDAADIAQNKLLAALAYVGPLVVVPLLAAPNSKFARFHCNQALVLYLVFFVVYCALWVFSMIPFFICLLLPFHFAAWLAVIFLAVVGVINAASGAAKPLPWIGHYRILG